MTRAPRDGTDRLHLEPVTRDNWEAVIALELEPAQSAQLASNLYSLAEAYVESQCRPRAIRLGRTIIGFAMYEYLPVQAAFNISRFMIDARWQGCGYGRAALSVLLDALAIEGSDVPVYISVRPGNAAARRLYARAGFTETGRHVAGELVMCRTPD